MCDEWDKGNSPGEPEDDLLRVGLFEGGEDNQEYRVKSNSMKKTAYQSCF